MSPSLQERASQKPTAQPEKLAVFGGSFDPPHIGHVLLVKYLLSTGQADRILIVPVYQHAFDKRLTDFDVRVRLCELAFCDEPRVCIEVIERDLPVPNYTLNTLRILHDQHPDSELTLVIGADVLPDLDKWHQVEEVTRLAPLLVVGRAGVRHPDAPAALLPEVSSTELRERLARYGGSPSESAFDELARLLPRRVLDEIVERRLYS